MPPAHLPFRLPCRSLTRTLPPCAPACPPARQPARPRNPHCAGDLCAEAGSDRRPTHLPCLHRLWCRM
eukprot:57512-Alexandrium_andersonii.AAC.1